MYATHISKSFSQTCLKITEEHELRVTGTVKLQFLEKKKNKKLGPGPCAFRHGIQNSMGATFFPATQLYPQNDWTWWQNGVNDDVHTQAPLRKSVFTFGFFFHNLS